MGMLYYYIMVDPDKPDKCKLGITTDPGSRIKAYKSEPEFEVKTLKYNVSKGSYV